jgi:hypothetical protein
VACYRVSFTFTFYQVIPAEVSEEGTENSGDGAGAVAPTHTDLKSGKTILSEDECLSQALNFMRRVHEDYDTFKKYMAMELRSLSSDTYRRMLKKKFAIPSDT